MRFLRETADALSALDICDASALVAAALFTATLIAWTAIGCHAVALARFAQ
jgi:hypothetical protein